MEGRLMLASGLGDISLWRAAEAIPSALLAGARVQDRSTGDLVAARRGLLGPLLPIALNLPQIEL